MDYKLGNFPAAIENYQRSLRILQAKSTLADKAQIRPLHGLGVSFMGARDPESAVVALKRAADLSRNTDGLFNIGQVEFIDVLIDAYAATGRFAEAEKESQYAMRVEEAAYGRSSVKLLDRLDKLARWYEAERRYTTERSVYDRALNILTRGAPENDLRRVGPLRGIARSFRLELFYGVEGADTGGTFNSGRRRCAGVRRGHPAAARRKFAHHRARGDRCEFPRQPAAARRSARRPGRLVPGDQRAASLPTTPMPTPGRRSRK